MRKLMQSDIVNQSSASTPREKNIIYFSSNKDFVNSSDINLTDNNIRQNENSDELVDSNPDIQVISSEELEKSKARAFIQQLKEGKRNIFDTEIDSKELKELLLEEEDDDDDNMDVDLKPETDDDNESFDSDED